MTTTPLQTDMRPCAEEILRRELLEARRRESEMTRVLGMINRLNELLPQKNGIEETCRELVHIVIAETDFDNCSIALWDPDHHALRLYAAFGLLDLIEESMGEYHRNLKFISHEEIAHRVFDTGEPIFIEDTKHDPIPSKTDSVIHPGALACLPLLDFGVLNASSAMARSFSSQTRRHLAMLGDIIGRFVLTASLNDRLRDTNRNLRHQVDEQTRTLGAKNRDLTAANRFLERIVDQSPEGICLLDSTGRITRTNKGMETFQKSVSPRLIGRSPAVLFQDAEIFRCMFDRTSSETQCRRSDVGIIDGEGRVRPTDVFLSRLNDDAGFSLGYLLVLYDLTEKKALDEQLMRTEKLAALGTMAGGVAHDFNNLLMSVLGNTELLLLTTEDETRTRRLRNIETAVRDAAHIVRRLHAFTAPPDENRLLASSDTVNIASCVEEVIEMTRARWKSDPLKGGNTIDLRVGVGRNCSAAFHASDLREVLTCLVLNAVDAMPHGGVIDISCKCAENVLLEVSDTGTGMTEDVRLKIFDPFFTTKGVGSSGLGLSVAWNLVNRQGGELSVRSVPGKGTTFSLNLPRTPEPVESLLPPPEPPVASGRDTLRVLVVDDDEEVLKLLRDMIRLSGHKVTALQDGKAALRILGEERFDLVLTDLGMPDVGGWEIAGRAKAKHPDVPVILVTGWGARYEEENLMEKGVDLVLSKPVAYSKLQESMESLLKRNRPDERK